MMKVEMKAEYFQPILITIESETELGSLLNALMHYDTPATNRLRCLLQDMLADEGEDSFDGDDK